MCVYIYIYIYTEIISVYFKDHMEYINTLRGKNSESSMLQIVVCKITLGFKELIRVQKYIVHHT